MLSRQEFQDLLSSIELRGWRVRYDHFATSSFEVTAVYNGFDGVEDSYMPGRMRPLSQYISPGNYYYGREMGWQCKEDVIEAIFCAIQFLSDHEIREGFKVRMEDGRYVRPYDPHGDSFAVQERTTKAQRFYESRKATLHGPDLSGKRTVR